MANEAVGIEGGWKKLRIAGWCFVALLLLLPAVAMQFTSEVDWTPSDFVVMGVLLGSAGLSTEFLVRRSGSNAYRIGAVVAMAAAFLTIWINLAVGMIGDDNPYNLLFGVLLLGVLISSIVVQFGAAGMARITLGAAIAQLLIAAGGLSMDLRGALFSVVFALPGLLAAVLFNQAAREN